MAFYVKEIDVVGITETLEITYKTLYYRRVIYIHVDSFFSSEQDFYEFKRWLNINLIHSINKTVRINVGRLR